MREIGTGIELRQRMALGRLYWTQRRRVDARRLRTLGKERQAKLDSAGEISGLGAKRRVEDRVLAIGDPRLGEDAERGDKDGAKGQDGKTNGAHRTGASRLPLPLLCLFVARHPRSHSWDRPAAALRAGRVAPIPACPRR